MKKLNQKGMTLMEVVVVLLISSIVMLIAGGMILNSMNFFNKTASTDADKLAVDKIASFVRDELIYSTNVKIQKEKPDEQKDWHSFSIDENGHLLYDGEAAYNNDYYNHAQLTLHVKAYDNNSRLDLRFAFEKNEQEVYKTTTTLELVNIREKLISQESNDTTKSGSVTSANVDHKTMLRIWYQKGFLDIEDTPDPKPDEVNGTVGDELQCKTSDNTVKWTTGGANKNFKAGDFVQYENIWYRAIVDIENSSPPSGNNKGQWKVIDRVWQINSAYEKDDVVEYPKGSNTFYIKTAEYGSKDVGDKYKPGNSTIWKKIDADKIEPITCKVIDAIKEKTVGGEYDRCSQGEEIKTYKRYMTVRQGEYIEYNNQVFRYTSPPETTLLYPPPKGSYWKLIEDNFAADLNIEYFKGDIVKDTNDGNYYQLLIERYNATSPPSKNAAYPTAYWKKVDIYDDSVRAPECRLSWNY